MLSKESLKTSWVVSLIVVSNRLATDASELGLDITATNESVRLYLVGEASDSFSVETSLAEDAERAPRTCEISQECYRRVIVANDGLLEDFGWHLLSLLELESLRRLNSLLPTNFSLSRPLLARVSEAASPSCGSVHDYS